MKKQIIITFFVLLFTQPSYAVPPLPPLPPVTHPIQNLTHVLEFSFGDNPSDAVNPNELPHFDGAITEGQTENSCLTNPEKFHLAGWTPPQGLTIKEMSAMYWTMRRHMVNKLYFLAGQVNRVKQCFKSKGISSPVPFYDYDPWFDGEFYHPELVDIYNNEPIINAIYGPYDWDGIFMRFDYFLQAQALGDYSFAVPLPAGGESGFNYWDRIPAHPIMDNCMWWKEGRINFQVALNNAFSHCVAGRTHLGAINRRILYLWPLEFLYGC